MLLESLFICLLILVFVVIFYRAANHEYTILQKDWGDEEVKWSNLISERMPIVVRQVPKSWTKLWTKARTAKFGWPVVLQENGKRMRTTWSGLLNAMPNLRQQILNTSDLANASGLQESAAEIGLAFRRPFWLPGSFSVSNLSAHVVPPRDEAFIGLRKTTAEATCWIATDGIPLRLWIAHEGATKGGEYLPPRPQGRDPWNLKPEESPWISELKFMEIRLRPGNLFVLPPHWWIGIKCDTALPDKPTMEGGWFWTCEFHSPISWLATRFQRS